MRPCGVFKSDPRQQKNIFRGIRILPSDSLVELKKCPDFGDTVYNSAKIHNSVLLRSKLNYNPRFREQAGE